MEKYRLLNEGEVTQENDEILHRLLKEGEVTQENNEILEFEDNWTKVAIYGRIISWGLEGSYRREV